jgi:hypothetical protein
MLHLSIPVRDLEEALDFYVGALGCQPARRREGFADVWFYGMQVTLQDRPGDVAEVRPTVRHFGVTLHRSEFDALVAHLGEVGVEWVVPVTTDDVGRPTEQTKGKIADPSGNVIEFKTYPDPATALEVPPG